MTMKKQQIKIEGAAPVTGGRLWDIDDTAAYLKCTKHKLYRDCENGKIPHLRLGSRSLRFIPGEIEAWVRGLMTAPRA